MVRPQDPISLTVAPPVFLILPNNSSGGECRRPQLSRQNSTNVSSESFHQGNVVDLW
jgi:hypothetical protein